MSLQCDRSRPIIYNEFDKIQVGDLVFDGCNGPCSGGALYDMGNRVIEVTQTEIIAATKERYSRTSGVSLDMPAYFIEYWQRA